jgi:hypothetical protein
MIRNIEKASYSPAWIKSLGNNRFAANFMVVTANFSYIPEIELLLEKMASREAQRLPCDMLL